MNISEYFMCPSCGAESISLLNAKPIISDVRVDTLQCCNCGAQWNLYSKISEMQVELISIPDSSIEETVDISND